MNEIFYSTLAAVPTAHALVLPADSDASLVVGVDAQAKTPIQAKAIARQPSGQFLFSLRCLSVAAAVARRVKICCLCCCCCAKLCWVIKSAVDNDDGASLDRQPCRAHLSSQQLAFVAHRTLRSPLSQLTTCHSSQLCSQIVHTRRHTHTHRQPCIRLLVGVGCVAVDVLVSPLVVVVVAALWPYGLRLEVIKLNFGSAFTRTQS